eukprot:TRINITY_DN7959_c0_g2_i4.p2 TRINITY_DN7959_c0_g2~~TRINITY_DN7959_c0_g2_i4.p2  ORF type:complete len:109 (+),score=15.37 TRINITY_DN7959_c0_g2_i4:388-714(+)
MNFRAKLFPRIRQNEKADTLTSNFVYSADMHKPPKNPIWYPIRDMNRKGIKFGKSPIAKVRPTSPATKMFTLSDLSPYEFKSTIKRKEKRIESAKMNKRVVMIGNCIM